MDIQVKKIHSCDVYSDGGTFILCFIDQEDQFYEFKLPVKIKPIVDIKSERIVGIDRVGYGQPQLHSYQRKMFVEMDWPQADALVERLNPHIDNDIGLGGKPMVEQMFDVLGRKGEFKPMDGVGYTLQ